MRKFKQVQRKEVTYDLAEWKQIEERAASVMLKTGTFIKRMSLEGKIIYFDMREVSEVMKALRIIGANINQIARKANDINNIYADDVEALRKEVEEIGHIFTRSSGHSRVQAFEQSLVCLYPHLPKRWRGYDENRGFGYVVS